MQGMRQAAQAQQARMAALGQQGSMAAQMQGQGLQLAGQKASAADAIAQFNAQNRQNVAGRNLGERQRIGEAGSATRNQEQMYNQALIQQRFQNEMAKATGVTGAQSALAQQMQQQAGAAQQAQQAQTGAILGAATTLGAAGIGAYGKVAAAKAASPTFQSSAAGITGQPDAPVVGGDFYYGPNRRTV
jgi:hypothetical protein